MDSDGDSNPASSRDVFVAELQRWRHLAGQSQKVLAERVGYTPSYVSKVEKGTLTPSQVFAHKADQELKAGRALIRCWKELHGQSGSVARHAAISDDRQDDVDSSLGPSLIVEHEHAELAFHDGVFKTRVRRELHNVGAEPVTGYLIRIAVDRFPGDPERSNELYRQSPLTWEEVNLIAECAGEVMRWRVKQDRDAFKEVWLQFENGDGRFPLYPGEKTWIEYTYSVSAEKWGPWWQRAIRLPTKRLSMVIDLPSVLQPTVWGMETSMTASASVLRTPVTSKDSGERTIFAWSTNEPPLNARYRLEWRFRAERPARDLMDTLSPSERMRSLGIVQKGDPGLLEKTQPFSLPHEAENARRVISELAAVLERVSHVHHFAKGMGVAAPQIGIRRSAAIVRPPHGDLITLLNPRIIDSSTEKDSQYEGCLSFFDFRGMTMRPIRIEVEHQDIDGQTRITEFEHGLARLVCHEIDHLNGQLYTTRLEPGVDLIPVSQYTGTGQKWRD